MEQKNNSVIEPNIDEVNSLMATFEIQELEERLEFVEAGWNAGSGCSSGLVCYNF